MRAGEPLGLLALDDDRPVGWVAVAPRSTYPRLDRSTTTASDAGPGTWSVTCFFVHRSARGRGLARTLVDAAVDFAADRGARVVEGHPVDTEGEKKVSGDLYHGTLDMFLAAGFSLVERRGPRRALVRKAGLYLLDEPMGQLEPQLRAVLRGRIKHYLREHNCTTILVTHDQTEANALADRIADMEGGVLQQYATPAELKLRPANLFVGTFIGEPPMNVFPVKMKDDGDRIAFMIEGGEGQSLVYKAADFSNELRQRLKREPSLMLGVRPHAVHIGGQGLKARVVTCQWLGDQTHIAADFAGGTIVLVEHDRARVGIGDTIGIGIEPRHLHIFDAATGEAVAHGMELA